MLTFSEYTLDPAGPELRRAGAVVDVQPRVLALLVYLASHPDRLVSKAELAEAVWQGQDASDEMIARAVMKARHALGDEARAPRYIVTEPGQGYRFCADPTTEGATTSELASASASPDAADQPASVPWNVLPFVNRSQDPALNWATTGLQQLLCHVMTRSAAGTAVTVEPAGSVLGSDSGMPSGRVRRAVAERPGQRWVACEIDHAPGSGYRLDLAWAGPGEPLAALSFTDPSLPALVQAVAVQLLPPAPWQRELARRHPQAWARLNETIAQLDRWPRDEAVRRLIGSFERLPPHPRLLMQRAWLLDERQATAESEQAALAALRVLQGEAAPDPEVVFQARLAIARCTELRGNLESAREHFDNCIRLVDQLPELSRDRQAVSLAWSGYARVHQRVGDPPASVETALNKAVSHAVASGVVAREIVARSALAEATAEMDGQVHRAEEMMRALVKRALEHGETTLAGRVMRNMAETLRKRGRCLQALIWAERAMAVSLPASGDRIRLDDARATLFYCLVTAGRLEQAEQVQGWITRGNVADFVYQQRTLNQQAWLRWRQGRLAEAEVCMRQELAEPRLASFNLWANFERAEYASLMARLGRAEEGRDCLAQLRSVLVPLVVGRAEAALAMAEGRREHAREQLATLAPQATLGPVYAYRIVLDLGWLCLEDGDHAQAEDLLDRALAMEVETVEFEWLMLALQDRSQPVEPQTWEALRQRSPSLVRNCPWLGTPEDVQARREGRAAPLPNLLSVLAW